MFDLGIEEVSKWDIWWTVFFVCGCEITVERNSGELATNVLHTMCDHHLAERMEWNV